MSRIKENISLLNREIPGNVTLVAVSKTRSHEEILEARAAGLIHFGENRIRELQEKNANIPDGITWHFIGHLQRNKVKYIAPFVGLIQSIDTYELAKEVEKEALKADRTIDCLLQFHIAAEEHKFGLNLDEAIQLITGLAASPAIRFMGVMGMATYTSDENQIRNEFRELRSIYKRLKSEYFSDKEYFREISMGMSGDFRIAIEEGSTMVRIGSRIFDRD